MFFFSRTRLFTFFNATMKFVHFRYDYCSSEYLSCARNQLLEIIKRHAAQTGTGKILQHFTEHVLSHKNTASVSVSPPVLRTFYPFRSV